MGRIGKRSIKLLKRPLEIYQDYLENMARELTSPSTKAPWTRHNGRRCLPPGVLRRFAEVDAEFIMESPFVARAEKPHACQLSDSPAGPVSSVLQRRWITMLPPARSFLARWYGAASVSVPAQIVMSNASGWSPVRSPSVAWTRKV